MYLCTHLHSCSRGVLNLSFFGTINSIPVMLWALLFPTIPVWLYLCLLFEFFPVIKENSQICTNMNMHLPGLSEAAVLCLYEIPLLSNL